MKDFKSTFGGSDLHGRRKTARPLSTKKPIHLIAKTSKHRFFHPGNRQLESLVFKYASKFKIKVNRLSLNWTHFHAILQIPSRAAYNAFIRSVTAAIVRAISKTAGKLLKGIFDLRPFTRIVEWGNDFRNVMAYHDLNDLEARGYIKRRKNSAGRRKPPKGDS